MKKIGYFRVTMGEKETYIKYDEFYDMSPQTKEYYKGMYENGKIHLTCACKEDANLELSITKNCVIRVKNNRQQDKHEDSCPKSERYEYWLSQNQDGAFTTEDGMLCFNISVPSGYKSESTSSGSSESSKGDGAKQRANIETLTKYINFYAWQKQTYSIKKQISAANKQGQKPSWSYKTEADFIKLFYGVSNEVNVYREKQITPFSSLCFRSSAFYNADYKSKFFLYAKVLSLGEYKEDRKYQYISIAAPNNNEKRLTVRIPTEDYEKMTEELNYQKEENCYLAGYVRHDSFEGTQQKTDWITLVKGIFFFTSRHGMFLLNRNTTEKALLDLLCNKRILFYRPVLPLESYGGNIPTLIIEQLYGKDILIDIVSTGQERTKREKIAEKNTEYDIMIYGKKTPAEEIVEELFEKFKARKQERKTT